MHAGCTAIGGNESDTPDVRVADIYRYAEKTLHILVSQHYNTVALKTKEALSC